MDMEAVFHALETVQGAELDSGYRRDSVGERLDSYSAIQPVKLTPCPPKYDHEYQEEPFTSYLGADYFETANFIRRRNERERVRVRNVNAGFERLRLHLPLTPTQKDKRLSKVETLRLAIEYIKRLQEIIVEADSYCVK